MRTGIYGPCVTEHRDAARAMTQQVADDLRDAFQSLAGAGVAAQQRDLFKRRLLAITTMAKRDMGRATQQLERLRRDLRAAETTTDSSLNE